MYSFFFICRTVVTFARAYSFRFSCCRAYSRYLFLRSYVEDTLSNPKSGVSVFLLMQFVNNMANSRSRFGMDTRSGARKFMSRALLFDPLCSIS